MTNSNERPDTWVGWVLETLLDGMVEQRSFYSSPDMSPADALAFLRDLENADCQSGWETDRYDPDEWFEWCGEHHTHDQFYRMFETESAPVEILLNADGEVTE